MKILVALLVFVVSLGAAAPQWAADYCVGCHSPQQKAGGLVLSSFNADQPEKNAETAEKVILKLRAGMMPPPGSARPDKAAVQQIVETLESKLDQASAIRPSPGWRPFQRLNRAEYARAVRDLVGLDVDVSAFLPADTVSGGFDNIADVQTFSPILMTAYLRGASQISRLAMADPVARKRIFTCRNPNEQKCAEQIVRALTIQASRGTATEEDVADALKFYAQGRGVSFDNGIRLALQSILMSPRFLFRVEPPPQNTRAAFRVTDQALASRLSYFLWGAGPDAELLRAAAALRTQEGLEKQVRRLLADKNSEAMSTRFAAQWLRLQDLDKILPDDALFPKYNAALGKAMRRETILFVDSVFRDDRNILDLFTARYSFLNEPLARHYGIPNITGQAFRRVQMPEDRRGLLGQGSILLSTSLADRTSPVLRGKWVMEVLFGTPPPPPPPNVPSLDESARAVRNGKTFSTRERIEQHRRNPACNSCHRVIDPLGIALENFDAVGSWRTTDNKVPVDSLGELYDGTKMNGPEGLRAALLDHQDLILRNFAANLLSYAIGRRLEFTDMPAVRSIVNAAAKSHDREGVGTEKNHDRKGVGAAKNHDRKEVDTQINNRFSSFVQAVVKTSAFQMSEPPVTKAP